MSRVRLVHSKPAEAEPRVALLKAAGHDVQYGPIRGLRDIADGNPHVVLIDLTRMPSHGREVATSLRGTKYTRHLPIVFAGGEPDKVAAIRRLIPDATYSTWESVIPAIRKAIAAVPADPVVPPQMMNRYRDRSAAQKLGITTGSIVSAIDPPRNFPDLLGELPEGVEFSEDPRRRASVTLWFVQDAAAYQSDLARRRAIARYSKLWVIWPKGEAGKRAGITQNLVREAALDAGLVDYKICAVDDKWSAILFAAAKSA